MFSKKKKEEPKKDDPKKAAAASSGSQKQPANAGVQKQSSSAASSQPIKQQASNANVGVSNSSKLVTPSENPVPNDAQSQRKLLGKHGNLLNKRRIINFILGEKICFICIFIQRKGEKPLLL